MDTSDGESRVSIVVPQLGVVEEVLVVEWLAADGDRVAKGAPLVVIDTDKAVTELPAPAAGLLRIAVPAGGDEVPVGTVLGYVMER